MKKVLWIIFLGITLVATSIAPVVARDRHRSYDRDRDSFNDASFADRARARQILRRTGEILQRAQRAADRGGYYQGLGKAVAHHRRSRRLFRADFYPEAVFHSMSARRIAFEVLKNNRAMSREDWRAMQDDDNRDFDLDRWVLREADDDRSSLRLIIEFD